jgi:hypothetical protein
MRLAGLVALVAAAAGGLAPGLALAGPAHALTDLDDARACLPLPAGGVAVGTGGGLAVVSRDRQVRTLTALDGLPDTRVHALAADGDVLWVGTDGGAAQVTLTPQLSVRRTVAVTGAPVHAVLATSTGVYLGTWGAGLFRVPSREAPPEAVPAAGGGQRIAALAEHGGSLYVAYADGPLARLESGKAVPVVDAPAHGQALAAVAASDGRAELVLGDLEGLFRAGQGVTPVASVDARGLAQGPGGTLLVATYGSGLLAGPIHGALRREAGVPGLVNGVAVRGDVRCAATTEGVFVGTGKRGYEKVTLGGLPSNDVTVVEGHGARVVVGTFDRGAAIVDGDGISPVQGLEPTEAINAAAWQESSGGATLWLGTARGIVRVAPDGTLRRLRSADGLPSSSVRSLLVRSDGRLLVGTDEGAALVDGEHVEPVVPRRKKKGPAPLASPMHATWAVAESADGTIWLGTNVGLYYGKGGAFRRVALATGDLADDWVTALAIRGSDVFVGTYAGGVTRLRPSGRAGGALEHAHLGGGCINPGGLTLMGDQLLAATMEGLLVRPAGDDRASWTVKAGATPGRDVTSARRVGDMLWVASRRGIGVSRL